MSGSVNLPPPKAAFLDANGDLSHTWRKFFQGLFSRTGGNGVTANAALGGNSNQTFAVATATTPVQAVPLAQYRAQPGQAPSNLTVGASPWTFSAPSNGFIVLDGGTVSNVEYQRAGVAAQIGNPPELIPLRQADQIIVTYSAAPGAIWFPN